MLCAALAVWFVTSTAVAAQESGEALPWLEDYSAAFYRAQEKGSQLLVWFRDPQSEGPAELREFWGDGELRRQAERFVLARVTTEATIELDEGTKRILERPAFAELGGKPGLAIIDFSDPQSRHYRTVISVYPFSAQTAIDQQSMRVLLDLPLGSLTQRTLILAVRTHPESPRSTQGDLLELLAEETERHSSHQASIMLQGHHNWDQRFHTINAGLPGQMVAQEVCAESWPGQPLLEAARECVHSWRQSSGHWSAVHRPHRFFAYDMKRGKNGVWYATGLFGDPR